MENKNIIAALAALAQESRLAIFRLLVQTGRAGLSAGKIGEALAIPPSSLSFHLKELSHANLVTCRQQGRFVICSANFETMNNLLTFLTENCCGGKPCISTSLPVCTNDKQTSLRALSMNQKPLTVLVLCTGNSCRSIIGEALFNRLGGNRVRALSAGSRPVGKVNENALATLARHGFSTEGYFSKSWDDLENDNVDIVVTVCDNAAGETCPAYLRPVMRAHWGMPDPACVAGTPEAVEAAFEATFALMQERVRRLLALPLETMSRETLGEQLSIIGSHTE